MFLIKVWQFKLFYIVVKMARFQIKQKNVLFVKYTLMLVASANSPIVVELIGELFIVELLYCNYLEFLKA